MADDRVIAVKSNVFERKDGKLDWTLEAEGHVATGEAVDAEDVYRQINALLVEWFGVPDRITSVLRIANDAIDEEGR